MAKIDFSSNNKPSELALIIVGVALLIVIIILLVIYCLKVANHVEKNKMA